MGFIIACRRNLYQCPIVTTKQSTKGGMIVSWENEENIKHYGISINNFNDENESCNTIGYQFILFDKEYNYDENEKLFVIASEVTPCYGEIIKENDITEENISRIIGIFETNRGFIFSKSELPEYLHSTWSSGDIYGIVNLFDTVSGMKESIKLNHNAILEGEFIKYIDPLYFNILENIYPDTCSTIELYKKVLELEKKSEKVADTPSVNDSEEKEKKTNIEEDSLEKIMEDYVKVTTMRKVKNAIKPINYTGKVISQNIEDWLNEQYVVPTAGTDTEVNQYEGE